MENAEAKGAMQMIRETLAAMKSCIQYGEPWTETMQEAYEAAMAALPKTAERDPFVLEQNAVWGDGPEWQDAIQRLKYDDLRLDAVAEEAASDKDPERLISAVLDTIAPALRRSARQSPQTSSEGWKSGQFVTP